MQVTRVSSGGDMQCMQRNPFTQREIGMTVLYDCFPKLMCMRIMKFWLALDCTFKAFYKNEFKEQNRNLHNFTSYLITATREKREWNSTDNTLQKEQCDVKKGLNNSTEEVEPLTLGTSLDSLMTADSTYTEEDVKYEVMAFMSTGADPASATLSACLLALATHQDIQEKLYREITKVCGNQSNNVTVDELKQMTYLDKVVKETLRRFMVVPLIAREIKEDLKLSSIVLPAGANVFINIGGLHMNPNVFPNPTQFDPERFSPENIAKRHKYGFIPFSSGPKSCIGSKYGTLLVKMKLIQILLNYHMTTDMKIDDMKFVIVFSMVCENGYHVKFEKRENKKNI